MGADLTAVAGTFGYPRFRLLAGIALYRCYMQHQRHLLSRKGPKNVIQRRYY